MPIFSNGNSIQDMLVKLCDFPNNYEITFWFIHIFWSTGVLSFLWKTCSKGCFTQIWYILSFPFLFYDDFISNFLHFGGTQSALCHSGSGTKKRSRLKQSSIFISFGSYILPCVHSHRPAKYNFCLWVNCHQEKRLYLAQKGQCTFLSISEEFSLLLLIQVYLPLLSMRVVKPHLKLKTEIFH